MRSSRLRFTSSAVSGLLLSHILVKQFVIAFSFYKVDLVLGGDYEVRVIGGHQTVAPHIVNDCERMHILSDFQKPLHLSIFVEEVDKCSFQSAAMCRIAQTLIDTFVDFHQIRFPHFEFRNR